MVDGTHLHGKYEGNLMIATAQDANNQIYPLAYVVVDSENDSSWTWFFQQLHVVIPTSPYLVFVSDRHLSIANGIEAVYTTAKHVFCTRHIKQNLKTKYKNKGIHKLFTKASESYTTNEFQEYFHQICEWNSEMGTYLKKLTFAKWTRAFCPGNTYTIFLVDCFLVDETFQLG